MPDSVYTYAACCPRCIKNLHQTYLNGSQTGSKRRIFLFCLHAKIKRVMETKNQQGKTPVLPLEQLGKHFTDFYAQWDYNSIKLKQLCCLMYDTYISETNELKEVNDASFFNMGFIDMLRDYSKEKSQLETGKLFRKHILDPLQGGNPFVLENMFYSCVGNQEDITIRKEVIKFYRSFEKLMDRVKPI